MESLHTLLLGIEKESVDMLKQKSGAATSSLPGD
jgi:hypothetical protein